MVPPTKLQGGLQSAAQLAEEAARRQKQEERARRKAAKEVEAAKAAAEARGEEYEDQTIHRDATGKKRDTKREKIEALRAKEREREKEMQKMEWGKGLVQREDKERKKREEEEMAAKPVARSVCMLYGMFSLLNSLYRYADDEDLNASQRDKMLWNDPAARFLTVSSSCCPSFCISHGTRRRAKLPKPRAQRDQFTKARHRLQIAFRSCLATDGMA